MIKQDEIENDVLELLLIYSMLASCVLVLYWSVYIVTQNIWKSKDDLAIVFSNFITIIFIIVSLYFYFVERKTF